MQLDIRFAIGPLFLIIGMLLLVQGRVSSLTPPHSLANANSWWGAVMSIFGLTVLLLAYRHRVRRRAIK